MKVWVQMSCSRVGTMSDQERVGMHSVRSSFRWRLEINTNFSDRFAWHSRAVLLTQVASFFSRCTDQPRHEVPLVQKEEEAVQCRGRSRAKSQSLMQAQV